MSQQYQRKLWVIIVIMVGVLWAFDIFPFSLGQVTIYIKECSNGFKVSTGLNPVTSCDGKLDYSYVTYRINPVNNSVTYWTDDGIIDTWKDCSIKDRSNWSCPTGGFNARTMKGGDLVGDGSVYKRRMWKVEYYLRKYNLMGAPG